MDSTVTVQRRVGDEARDAILDALARAETSTGWCVSKGFDRIGRGTSDIDLLVSRSNVEDLVATLAGAFSISFAGSLDAMFLCRHLPGGPRIFLRSKDWGYDQALLEVDLSTGVALRGRRLVTYEQVAARTLLVSGVPCLPADVEIGMTYLLKYCGWYTAPPAPTELAGSAPLMGVGSRTVSLLGSSSHRKRAIGAAWLSASRVGAALFRNPRLVVRMLRFRTQSFACPLDPRLGIRGRHWSHQLDRECGHENLLTKIWMDGCSEASS
jgi:hypothetical protein